MRVTIDPFGVYDDASTADGIAPIVVVTGPDSWQIHHPVWSPQDGWTHPTAPKGSTSPPRDPSGSG